MNDLQIFENAEFGEVRTIEENGKVLFCGSDVAKALGYDQPHKAIDRHCKSDGTTYTVIDNLGREQQAKFISESDVYRLIVKASDQSKSLAVKEKAEHFEKWVFDEVLPSIRRNGGYIDGQENYSQEEILAKAVLLAQNVIAEQNRRINAMRPKEIFADAVAASHTSILIGDLAKLLKQNGIEIGQKRLFQWLRDNGYLIKTGDSRNMPTQYAMERALFAVKESTVANPDGSIRVTRTTKVTGKGQQYFIDKFLNTAVMI